MTTESEHRQDVTLARRAAGGDESAWRELYDRSCQNLLNLLCFQTGDRDMAKDLLQLANELRLTTFQVVKIGLAGLGRDVQLRLTQHPRVGRLQLGDAPSVGRQGFALQLDDVGPRLSFGRSLGFRLGCRLMAYNTHNAQRGRGERVLRIRCGGGSSCWQ